MGFRIGQEVVCINNTPPPEGWKDGYNKLIKNKTYTISEFTWGGKGCNLVGVKCQRKGGFLLDRFVNPESKDFSDKLIEELELEKV